MSLRQLLNPAAVAVVPAEGSPHVRRVSVLDDMQQKRQALARKRQEELESIRAAADAEIDAQENLGHAGVKGLDAAREFLNEGPMTAPWFSVHGQISISHAKRVLEKLVSLDEAERRTIRGVRPFVYFKKGSEL